MTTLSDHAVDLIRGGLHSLKAAGEAGHTGDCYWTSDGAKRCGWGHIIGAAHPGHDLEDFDVASFRMFDETITQIDAAYEAKHGETIDATSSTSYPSAVAKLEALLLDAVAADTRIEVRNAR